MTRLTLRARYLLQASLLVIFGCSGGTPTILSQLKSPGGDVTAYLTKQSSGGGATGNINYSVFLSARGDDKLGRRVFLADYCADVRVYWLNENTVAIGYRADCEIFEFRNHWYGYNKNNPDQPPREVEIVLIRDS